MTTIRRFRDPNGEIHEVWYDSYKDVPDSIEVEAGTAQRMFEAPSFRFRGAFSGGTTDSQIVCAADDGSYSEPGRQKDIVNQRKFLEDKRDKERHDFLAKEFANFDESSVTEENLFS